MHPDDVNLNVYLCVRQHNPQPGVIVADAAVTISVVNETTGQQVLKRTGRAAKPSGDSFRDYMSVFSRSDLLKLHEKQQQVSSRICFAAEFSVRLVRVWFENPDMTMPDRDQMLSVTGFDMALIPTDMAIIPEREEQLLPFPAAKCVVTQRSSFFQKYFSNPANANDTEVRMDVTWMSLSTFVRYSYTADILIGPEHMFELMRDALKYEYFDVSFAIGSMLTVESVFNVRNHAADIADAGITDMCDQFIAKHMDKFLVREQFAKLQVDDIVRILSDEKVAIPETQLWNLTQDWLVAEIDRQNVVNNQAQRRKLMLPFLHLIRFPLMPQTDLFDGPIRSQVLTLPELTDILGWLTKKEMCKSFDFHQRNGQMWAEEETKTKKKTEKKKRPVRAKSAASSDKKKK